MDRRTFVVSVCIAVAASAGAGLGYVRPFLGAIALVATAVAVVTVFQLDERLRRRVQRKQAIPAPPAVETDTGTGYDVLLPWVENGELVLTLQGTDSTSERSSSPASWRCRVLHPGSTWVVARNIEQLIRWKVTVRFPGDFTPRKKLLPGAYTVVWEQGTFVQFTLDFAGWQEIGRRSFHVGQDWKVGPA